MQTLGRQTSPCVHKHAGKAHFRSFQSTRLLSAHSPPTSTLGSLKSSQEILESPPACRLTPGDVLGSQGPGLYLRLARVAVGLDEDGPDADVLAHCSQRWLHGLARSQDRHAGDLQHTARVKGKARCRRCIPPQYGMGSRQWGALMGNPKAHPFQEGCAAPSPGCLPPREGNSGTATLLLAPLATDLPPVPMIQGIVLMTAGTKPRPDGSPEKPGVSFPCICRAFNVTPRGRSE